MRNQASTGGGQHEAGNIVRSSSVRWRRDQLGGGRGALPVPGAAAAPAGARRGSRRAPRPRRPRAGGGGHLGREGAGVQVNAVITHHSQRVSVSELMSSTLQEPPPRPERPHRPGGEGCVRAAARRGRTPSQCGLQSAGHPGEAAPAPGQVTAGGI